MTDATITRSTPLTEALANAPRTAKGARTRARILEVAVQLFLEHGYDETTMRVIAREAGVSLGSAYYYFESKEQLIQGFYARTHAEHLEACREPLTREADLRGRLVCVLRTKLGTIMPYHRFAGILFRTAADPASPLNPFSEQSREVRKEATALFGEALEGAKERIPRELRAELPNLLWVYQMGLILFWIHDRSPGCERTYRLTEQTADLVVRLILLSRLAPFRPLARAAIRLVHDQSGQRPVPVEI